MTNNRIFFRSATVMLATTLGAGLFALPYVFSRAGWALGLLYLVGFSAVVGYVHRLYFSVLEKVQEKNRLLGLVRQYGGRWQFYVALAAIVGGLLLTLLVYIILGGGFLTLIFPGLSVSFATWLFWAVVSVPLVFGLRRLVTVEFLGAIVMTGLILFLFADAERVRLDLVWPALSWTSLFLPFGPILFALAGWTAVEPIYDLGNSGKRKAEQWGMVAGTVMAAVLYFVFALSIFGSAMITEDTLSGLIFWPFWKLALFGILGIFLIVTSYLPVAWEVKNALIVDLKLRERVGLLVVLFTPILLWVLGANQFFQVVSLVGGVFLSLEYLFILEVARRVLDKNLVRTIIIFTLSLIFLAAAGYEIFMIVKPEAPLFY